MFALYLHSLAQFLTHSRCSTTICWMNELTNKHLASSHCLHLNPRTPRLNFYWATHLLISLKFTIFFLTHAMQKPASYYCCKYKMRIAHVKCLTQCLACRTGRLVTSTCLCIHHLYHMYLCMYITSTLHTRQTSIIHLSIHHLCSSSVTITIILYLLNIWIHIRYNPTN